IASRINGGVDLAVWRLAVAEYPNLDHRPLSNLTQELAAEIVGAVIERDHRNAAQDDRPEPLLGLLYALERGDDWAEPAGGDHRGGVDEIALARSRHVRGDQVHRCGRKRAAGRRRHQSRKGDRGIERLVVLATDALEGKFGQQIDQQLERRARLILGRMLRYRRDLKSRREIELSLGIIARIGEQRAIRA